MNLNYYWQGGKRTIGHEIRQFIDWNQYVTIQIYEGNVTWVQILTNESVNNLIKNSKYTNIELISVVDSFWELEKYQEFFSNYNFFIFVDNFIRKNKLKEILNEA